MNKTATSRFTMALLPMMAAACLCISCASTNDMSSLPGPLAAKLQGLADRYAGADRKAVAARSDKADEGFVFLGNSVHMVIARDKVGTGYELTFYPNTTMIGSYKEFESNTVHGTWLGFHENGKLSFLYRAKKGRLLADGQLWSPQGSRMPSGR